MENKIKRHAFLKSLGLKGASLLAVYCGVSTLSSCKNESVAPASSVDFSLDLTNATYSKLNTVGNYVIANGIVIARVSSTGFAAVTQVCSHENKANVIYSGGGFYCTQHGATFSTTGAGTNANGSKGIKAYQTSLSGTSLRIFA
ncbi:Rieske 2Fe-2S domain-containing protein [Aquirufa antheringensis]|uniref:Rieske 2Fe-2S domain-containing protein n=1 Tax=Aquirufa antheringensis TaxID=2516559 RepID=UPI001032B85A|nr:Rieske 2Fe-2S domain-containing protein [Aquirufa antheringensis]MCE4217033.1 Rieske 2Fe-2S domain-containing protein [Pseudarcicella sp. GAP-15]TBH72704.1 Rieske (2Fe-2S) protein [Aquirufa antheringensis]